MGYDIWGNHISSLVQTYGGLKPPAFGPECILCSARVKNDTTGKVTKMPVSQYSSFWYVCRSGHDKQCICHLHHRRHAGWMCISARKCILTRFSCAQSLYVCPMVLYLKLSIREMFPLLCHNTIGWLVSSWLVAKCRVAGVIIYGTIPCI